MFELRSVPLPLPVYQLSTNAHIPSAAGERMKRVAVASPRRVHVCSAQTSAPIFHSVQVLHRRRRDLIFKDI